MPPVTSQGVSYRKLAQAELNLICAKHDRLWSSRPGGARAVLAWADLSGLDLRGRNLCDADLTGAVLTDCLMQKVRLDNANLTGADLFEADLREGAVATADRREGFRRLEPRVAPGQAQNAVLAGANLERSRLSGIMALKADLTDTNSPLALQLSEKYQVDALPLVVFIGPDGKERPKLRLLGFEGSDQFVRRLQAMK